VRLPDDVAALVAEGIGAYIRAAPADRLPKNLRRLTSFRPKSLVAHRDELLAALDDEVQRKLIVEWLDRGRELPSKKVQESLRLAAGRPEDWEAELASLSREPAPAVRPPHDYKAELEAERARSRRLRDDRRKAVNEMRAEAEAEHRRARALERDNTALTRRTRDLEGELAKAETERARAMEAAERRLRRLERDVERARAARDDARRELKEARRRITELEREPVRERTPRPSSRKQGDRPEREPPPERRIPLRVPKGLFEEDPETLDEWLKSPNVSLLVDGYNVSKAQGGFGDLNLESQRARLIEEIDRLARARRLPATIVFDGARIPPGAVRRPRKQVRVEYSRPPEIADDHLIALLAAMDGYPVVVVTNDRELQGRAAELGATIARSQQLLALIR
jgi:predicted RNA-binding protein with PIN domain